MNNNNNFFDNFALQRKMYFNVCRITNYGEYYFSTLIKDSDWNYFIPYTKEALLDNLDSIEKEFKKNNRTISFAIPSYIDDNEKILKALKQKGCLFGNKEQWLECSKKPNKKEMKYTVVKTEAELDLFKYILIRTYSSSTSKIQPYGNLNEEYLKKIENLKINQNQTNLIYFFNNSPVSACTICFDGDLSAIYNVAILPKYQDTDLGYNAVLGAIKECFKSKCNKILIQVPRGSFFNEWLLKNGFIDLFYLTFCAKKK